MSGGKAAMRDEQTLKQLREKVRAQCSYASASAPLYEAVDLLLRMAEDGLRVEPKPNEDIERELIFQRSINEMRHKALAKIIDKCRDAKGKIELGAGKAPNLERELNEIQQTAHDAMFAHITFDGEGMAMAIP